MENKVLKPKIRFKGFTDTWEQRKVTDVGKIFIGLVTTMTKNYTDEGTLLIRNSDIKDNHFEFNSNTIYLDECFAKLNDNRRMHIGDVVTIHTGDVGTSAVITEKEDGSIGFATIVTRPNQKIIDSNYLSTYLNTEQHKEWAINQSTGDGRTNYNLKEFTQLVVPLPSLKEQQCISKYIKQIDNLITLHQSKYDKLVNVKKALLEKMFPKDGKNVPEIRFKGFTDTWEQRKLEEIYKFQYGEFNNNPSNGGIYPVYGANGIIGGYTNYNAENSVIIGHMGEYAGSVLWGNGKHFVTYNGTISKPRGENVVSKFGYYMLYQKDINKICGGSGLPFLSYEQLNKIEVCYPKDIKEQKSIVNYLTNIDNLITLHQHKLEKLQNIKKSLLNKMFV